MMRRLGSSFLCLMLALLTSPLLAQSESADSQATILFDVQLDKIVNSPLGKELDLKGKMAMMPVGNGPDMAKCARIFGASTMPADMEGMMAAQQGNMDGIDFFVRFKFMDEEATKSMMVKPMEDNDGVVEKDGKKFYKAPANGGAPEGVMIYQVDKKHVELGTDKMLFRSNAKPFTANLNSAFSSAGDNAVRLVMDLESNGALVDTIIEQAKSEGGNPMVGQMIGVLKKMKSLAIMIDLNSKNLVTITSVGSSEKAAGEVKEAMDALKFLAQTGIKGQAGQMKERDPDTAKVAMAMADAMSVTAKGDVVSFVIPRPEGFEKAIGKAVGPMMGMMMGGMGGPPSDF